MDTEGADAGEQWNLSVLGAVVSKDQKLGVSHHGRRMELRTEGRQVTCAGAIHPSMDLSTWIHPGAVVYR